MESKWLNLSISNFKNVGSNVKKSSYVKQCWWHGCRFITCWRNVTIRAHTDGPQWRGWTLPESLAITLQTIRTEAIVSRSRSQPCCCSHIESTILCGEWSRARSPGCRRDVECEEGWCWRRGYGTHREGVTAQLEPHSISSWQQPRSLPESTRLCLHLFSPSFVPFA